MGLLLLMQLVCSSLYAEELSSEFSHCVQKENIHLRDLERLGKIEMCRSSKSLEKLAIVLKSPKKKKRNFCFVPTYLSPCNEKIQIVGKVQCINTQQKNKYFMLDLSKTFEDYPNANYLAVIEKDNFEKKCIKSPAHICKNYLFYRQQSIAKLLGQEATTTFNYVLWDMTKTKDGQRSKDAVTNNISVLMQEILKSRAPYLNQCISLYLYHSKGYKKAVLDWDLTKFLDIDDIALDPIEVGHGKYNHFQAMNEILEKVKIRIDQSKLLPPSKPKQLHTMIFNIHNIPPNSKIYGSFLELKKNLNSLKAQKEFRYFSIYRSPPLVERFKKSTPQSVKPTNWFFSLFDDEEKPESIVFPDEYNFARRWMKEIVSFDQQKVEYIKEEEMGEPIKLFLAGYREWLQSSAPSPSPLIIPPQDNPQRLGRFYDLRQLAFEEEQIEERETR